LAFAAAYSLAFVNSKYVEVDVISALPNEVSDDFAVQRFQDGVKDKLSGTISFTLTSNFPGAEIYISTRSGSPKTWFSLATPITATITSNTYRRIFNIRSSQEVEFQLTATASSYTPKSINVSIKNPPPPPPPAPVVVVPTTVAAPKPIAKIIPTPPVEAPTQVEPEIKAAEVETSPPDVASDQPAVLAADVENKPTSFLWLDQFLAWLAGFFSDKIIL